jgi:hypothetical protein
MGLDVKIRMVGRKNGGEKWLETAYDTYETRLQSSNVNADSSRWNSSLFPQKWKASTT